MNMLPSPPSSPILSSYSEKPMCGECDKVLESGWFCSNCHRKCNTCNRFLGEDEHCSRCWSFDAVSNQYLRKSITNYKYNSTLLSSYYQLSTGFYHGYGSLSVLPSPSSSSGQESVYPDQ